MLNVNVCPSPPPDSGELPPWHYICHQCSRHFNMPVPRGPTEERNRTCPNCGSKEIEHVGDRDNKPCPPGG